VTNGYRLGGAREGKLVLALVLVIVLALALVIALVIARLIEMAGHE